MVFIHINKSCLLIGLIGLDWIDLILARIDGWSMVGCRPICVWLKELAARSLCQDARVVVRLQDLQFAPEIFGTTVLEVAVLDARPPGELCRGERGHKEKEREKERK